MYRYLVLVILLLALLDIKMWFDEAGEVLEMFRSSFPLSFLFFVPILIILSPVSPANAAQEFSVFRMQQYDLQGVSYGNNTRILSLVAI